MELFIVVIAILFVQVWGSENPLHQDTWFHSWLTWLEQRLSEGSLSFLFVSVGVPVIGLAVLFGIVHYQSYWLTLPFAVIVLLYSFGRGEFSEIVDAYTHACYQEDWAEGVKRASGLNVDVSGVPENDWEQLHQRVFEEAAYRGFERMFAVLFWFFVLGPVGAMAYRLCFLFCQSRSGHLMASKFLWLIEWPAVRILGLSFAMTGNFVGCIKRWNESLFCLVSSTQKVISNAVLGALSVDEDIEASCEVTRKELSLMDRLYLRTLWFWLAAAAIIVIIK